MKMVICPRFSVILSLIHNDLDYGFPSRTEDPKPNGDPDRPTALADCEFCDVSVWDLYYYQHLWMRSEFGFRPVGPWEAFDISPEEEINTEDWELRIEQRIWLQENFGLTSGARVWTPFRLETAVRKAKNSVD
jgi:hypothetical protein